MRLIIKKILPKYLILIVRRIRLIKEIGKLYNFDRKRLIKYAYGLNKEYTRENLRSKITFHYHAIEKGLSNANIRLGFGNRAFIELFWAMDEYIKKGYPSEDYRFQSAISVIKSYIDLHRDNNFPVTWIEDKVGSYFDLLRQENISIGGFRVFKKNDLPEFDKLSFKDLSSYRFSIRDFGIKDIEDSQVISSINIASRTPSVCNRQSWKIRYVRSLEKVCEIIEVQNGFSGNGLNLRKLLIVTADKQFMNGGHERNQTYIDGGLFTMSLLYALTSNGIASCTLNASFDMRRELEMRSLLNVEESEDFIAVIAIGSYPDVFKVAKSPREEYSTFTTFIS